MSSLHGEIKLLQTTNQEATGSYAENKTIVRRRIEKVAKSVPIRFVRMMMCISSAIPNWCARVVSDEHLCRN